ncbi:hypothetical protein R1flu_001390 [Riccia fluitans]|uniref:Uncharacterized protein n=1 Tax=Riccia fluitans TaxID=41844 RepID=A0ABD1Y3K7_9MARC
MILTGMNHLTQLRSALPSTVEPLSLLATNFHSCWVDLSELPLGTCFGDRSLPAVRRSIRGFLLCVLLIKISWKAAVATRASSVVTETDMFRQRYWSLGRRVMLRRNRSGGSR